MYGKCTWSNSDCPVMQNMFILRALMIGTTEAASSEVQPITRARFGVLANSWLTAGTASAGSPRVSTLLQANLGPSAASTPLNGATSATVRVAPGLAPDAPELPLELLLPQAASTRDRAEPAATAAKGRACACLLRMRDVCLRSPEAGATGTGVVDFMDSPWGGVTACERVTWTRPGAGHSPGRAGAPSGRQRQSSGPPTSATTRLRMVPTSSTVTSMTSPGSIQTGGVRAKPTPPGVPVAITSPGARRVKEEKNSIAAGTLTSICEVRADCITLPLRVELMARSLTSTSSVVTTSGPIGMLPVKFFPAVHWLAARCQSRQEASLRTTKPAMASSAFSVRM